MSKNTKVLDIFISKIGLKSKVLEDLLGKTRQTIYNYRTNMYFEDLPLSVQIRFLFYSKCENIIEFKELTKNMSLERKAEIKETFEKMAVLMKHKREREKNTGIHLYMTGEPSVMDIARIGNNIREEIPEKTQEKRDELFGKSKIKDILDEKVTLISNISIRSNISSSYSALLEEILNKILKKGNDYEFLAYLDRYKKDL